MFDLFKDNHVFTELLNEKLKLQAVLNSMPVGVFIIDKDGKFTHINDIVQQIWGVDAPIVNDPAEYRQYKGWWADTGKAIAADEWAAAKALKGKASYGEVINIQSFDGKMKTILNSASPIFDLEGKVDGAVVVNSDITNLKKMEQELQNHKKHLSRLVEERTMELQESNERLKHEIAERDLLQKQIRHLDQLNLVGQMAAGLGHEIRNPMTTIRGFMQILQANKDFADYAGMFHLIISELDRMNEIISEYLSLAKNKRINKKRCCINKLIESIAPLIQADLILTNKLFQLNLEPNLPLLLVDENEIKQLVLNFARNGNEAMLPGNTLTISTYHEGEGVTLAIQDEGSGIDREMFEEISKPFFTTKSNGTGLGLPICYSIAQRHHATIEFETSNKGTTFYIKFKV